MFLMWDETHFKEKKYVYMSKQKITKPGKIDLQHDCFRYILGECGETESEPGSQESKWKLIRGK